MSFNLIYLTRMTDQDIQDMLNNTTVQANRDVVLSLLELANMLFNQHSLEYHVVRGAAYLKAANSVAIEIRDVSTLSKLELMQIQHIGEVMAESIILIVENRG